MSTKDALTQLATIPVTDVSGIGPKQAEKLAKLSIFSIQDLLLHLPFRYEDRTRVTPISECRPGMLVVIEGVIQQTRIIPARRRMMVCMVSDGEAFIQLRFFNFFQNMQRHLASGQRVRCFGEIRGGQQGLEIIHPEYQLINSNNAINKTETLTPVYPTTEGVGQALIRRWTDSALGMLSRYEIQELFQPLQLAQLNVAQLNLNETLQFLHRPPADSAIEKLNEGSHPAQQRLIVEELLAHQVSLLQLRKQTRQLDGYAIPCSGQHLKPLLDQLPFSPTGAQQRVYQEICADLAQPTPMMRLIQGDVGSGKTLVAVMMALQVLNNNQQVALMAPTELLSEQHYHSIRQLLEPIGFKTVCLVSKLKASERREALAAIAEESALMVIGTHALFQEKVAFHDLALIIVDEQHRFGVDQRLTLKEKGIAADRHPHQAVMTATPIPRTLAMSVYADLETSIIDELPPGRTPIETLAMSSDKRPSIIQRLRQACGEEKRQVYWVCPLIEESDNLTFQAAEQTYELLQKELPELSVGLVHGRLKGNVKSELMAQFKAGDIDILVATTVIEVGVDVPNASLMVIENAERFGLAQLHQLRGRVGRGSTASHCILLYDPPLSRMAEQRIAVMRESNDGFVIAEKDLELRGPGEVLGTRQTGVASFRIADIYRDQNHLPTVNQVAKEIVNSEPELAQQLMSRWMGHREQYAKV